MQKSIIEAFPVADIRIAIVWINMLQGDSEERAQKAAQKFTDARVTQFYDPEKHTGQKIAASIGWDHKVAWDIYLFYSAGSVWDENPPDPAAWMHQLKEDWADQDHFHTGDDLATELKLTLMKLKNTSAGGVAL